MEAGDILFHSSFKFNDGTTGRKLLIVLNTPDFKKNEPYLVIKTTSQLKGKQMVPGCIAAWRIFYIPPAEGVFFKDPTLLQLDDIYEMDATTVLKNGLQKNLELMGKLSTQIFGQLRNCIKQIKEDISEKHYKLIFK
jgi:hypothetical protein